MPIGLTLSVAVKRLVKPCWGGRCRFDNVPSLRYGRASQVSGWRDSLVMRSISHSNRPLPARPWRAAPNRVSTGSIHQCRSALGTRKATLAVPSKNALTCAKVCSRASSMSITIPCIILETAVETHIQAQGMEPKDFSTAPLFTKTVNLSMASNG